MKKKELWVVFCVHGIETGDAYTLNGTFSGELEATKELIAYEKGVKPEDVTAKLVKR